MEDKSKIIRIEMVRPSYNYPFPEYENEKIVDQYYIDMIMCAFREKIKELQPDEIINIKDNPFEKRYSIDITIRKY